VQFFFGGRHGGRLAKCDGVRPLGPPRVVVPFFQRGVHRPVVEPEVVLFEALLGEVVVLAGVFGEVLERLAEQTVLECRDAIEVDAIVGELRCRSARPPGEVRPRASGEITRIPGVRRVAAVRRRFP
jgi:hypothetical protein